MPPTSKVDLYAAIRRDAREGLSQRALERKHGLGRRSVLKALASAWPEPRKPLPPRPSRLDPFKVLIDGMLRVDLDAPRKQRHTAKRIFDRLIDEHGMTDVSYQIVRGPYGSYQITPQNVRIRKVELDVSTRGRAAARAKHAG